MSQNPAGPCINNNKCLLVLADEFGVDISDLTISLRNGIEPEGFGYERPSAIVKIVHNDD
jgi:hypothetical protein